MPAGLSAQEQDKTMASPLGFAGSLATLEAPVFSWGHVCSRFQIFATGEPVRGAVVALEGLGPATLARTGGDTDCGPARGEDVRLTLPFLDGQGDWLRLRLPVSLFPTTGGLDGHIRVYAGDADPLDIPVRLEPRGANAFLLSMSWFFGIAVPAMAGYYVWRLQELYQAHAAQQRAARDYMLANRPAFDALFDDYLPNLSRSDPDHAAWSASILEKLEEHLGSIPPEPQLRLVTALRNAQRDEALDLLARIYHPWATQIRSCR
jgi:hypothetical protein